MSKLLRPGPPWFRPLGNRHEPRVRLFCFHHAGGAASVYREWPAHLAHFVEPVAVQLPGRENRIHEGPMKELEPLIETLVTSMEPFLDAPFAFYGHSMGARIAMAVTRALEARSLPLPAVLFVASSAAPSFDLPVDGSTETGEDLVSYVRGLGGTPEEILSNPAYLAELLPVLRADLTLVSTAPAVTAPPISVPIHAFVGRDDQLEAARHVQTWAAETTSALSTTTVDGGHFFSPDGHRDVVAEVSRWLEECQRRPAGSSSTPLRSQA